MNNVQLITSRMILRTAVMIFIAKEVKPSVHKVTDGLKQCEWNEVTESVLLHFSSTLGFPVSHFTLIGETYKETRANSYTGKKCDVGFTFKLFSFRN